ncbi:MAG: hypothetical protein AMXMBFR56_29320 [Polyangiaceae bacterium]
MRALEGFAAARGFGVLEGFGVGRGATEEKRTGGVLTLGRAT